MKVIPAIDLRGGRCVRLLKGEFDKETEYSTDPGAIARRFAELGVDDLHIVDLDGARGGIQENRELVQRIAADSPLSVQLGGGIREGSTIADWLQRGVARCVIGSIAVTDADTTRGWLTGFGPDRLVLALDVRIDEDGVPRLATHGWERTAELSLWQCVDSYREVGVQHVLCTDVDRDGAMSGPNTELYAEFVARYPDIDLQASGGVRGIGDLIELRNIGATAAITGRALLDGALGPAEVQSFLQDA